MMWRASRRLISLTSAASVVVFPEPVGPPTSTRPRGRRRERFDARRQAERREARHRRRQAADRRGGAPALVMQVDPEAAEIGRAERRRRRCRRRVRLARVRRQRRNDGVRDLLAAQRRFVERRHDAVDPQRRRRAGHQQQIAGGPFDDLFQPPAQPRGLGVVRGADARRGRACRDVERCGAPAFSSVTSASRSSGSVIARTARDAPAAATALPRLAVESPSRNMKP